MPSYSSYSIQELSPKALLYLLLVTGLIALIYAIVAQEILIAAAIICLPIVVIAIGYGIQRPRFIYLLYASYSFFFIAISRYTRQDKLSVGLEIILVLLFISILFVGHYNKKNIVPKNAINIFTLSYTVWVVFILLQLMNPGIDSEGITEGIRVWILRIPVLYIAASILSDTPKMLRNSLIVVGIFTIIAFIKLLCQKYIGFDSAESYWLFVQEEAKTHILHSGIRYFSYFSDAANFGSYMGVVALVYSITGFNLLNKKISLFYLSIAVMGVIGMLLSGTRGALIIPFTGLALYCLLCKSIRVFIITMCVAITAFAFFAYTDIGSDNPFIRRARTAFHPTKDASFNVRVNNRIEMAEYLKKYPWGIGLSEDIPKLWPQNGTYIEGTLPPDSFFVSIWIQTGFWGMLLYITILTVVLLRCCYIVMFRVRNKELRQVLAALTCGTFGILLSGYTGDILGQPPTDFLVVAMVAFVMNGATIDKQITQQKAIPIS